MRLPPITAMPTAIVIALLLAACGASDDADAHDGNPTVRPELQGTEDDVLVIGDSLTNGAQMFGDLDSRLAGVGFDERTIIAEDSRDPRWGLEQIEALDEVPSIVVVELGTNPNARTAGFAEQVDAIIAALRSRGAERIAWVTPVYGSDDRYDDKIEILRDAEGIDEVADWASVVHDDPRRLAADGLHPETDAYPELASFLVAAATELVAD